MKIEDIKKGRKYWKKHSRVDSRKNITTVTGIPVLVLEVKLEKNEVFASLNGGPPRTFTAYEFARWKDQDPSIIKPTNKK